MLASSARTSPREPRVVILYGQGIDAAIDVVDLPTLADVGTEFCHLGGRWRVTGSRPRTRVLLAEQVSWQGFPTSH